MNTPLGFPFGFYVADNTPLDGKYGIIDAGVWRPYFDTAEAIAEVPIGIRHIGLTVNVGNVEYWWEAGITDLDLVTKGGGGGAFWPLGGAAELEDHVTIDGVTPGYSFFSITPSWANAISGIGYVGEMNMGSVATNFTRGDDVSDLFAGLSMSNDTFQAFAGSNGTGLSQNISLASGILRLSASNPDTISEVVAHTPDQQVYMKYNWDQIANPGVAYTRIAVQQTQFAIESSDPTFVGAQYGADFSANYTPRSLPDVEWVLDQIATAGGDFWPLNGAATFTGNVDIDKAGFGFSLQNVTGEGGSIFLRTGDTTVPTDASLQMDIDQAYLYLQNNGDYIGVDLIASLGYVGLFFNAGGGGSSFVQVEDGEVTATAADGLGGQTQINMQFGQTLITSTDGIDTGTQSFSYSNVSFQFPGSTGANFSGQDFGVNLLDGANGATLEMGATALTAQFRLYDWVNSSGIQFDITEFNINSPEIHLNADSGILNFIGLTIAAVGGNVPTDTVIINLGGVPYYFFVKPV